MSTLTEHNAWHDLHVCPDCASPLVYPVSWETHDEVWEMVLRCPECESCRGGRFGREAVEAFEMELERGDDELLESLRDLTRRNMEDELAMFGRALYADALLPEDF